MQVFVTGATGRLGRILRAAWAELAALGFAPVWSCRQPLSATDVVWDIATDPLPVLLPGVVILHLAGVVRGDTAELAGNAQMALRVCEAARSAGAAHVFLASSASVYGAGLQDHVEVHPPAPITDYGHSKLRMERDAFCWAHQLGQAAPGVSCLRIGNVLGADALFGQTSGSHPIVLDPVAGQVGGLQRSYIGPNQFAKVLADLIGLVAAGHALPKILNISAEGTVSMAELLDAADRPYRFGKPNPKAIPRVGLSTKRLYGLLPLRAANANSMVAEFKSLKALVS